MSVLRTPLCPLLQTEFPIVQAPIGSATCPVLAAAVSNAGGLGMLALTWKDSEQIRQILRDTVALTHRPFGVNLVLQWPQKERLKICLEEGVKIISFFWGDPSPYIAMVHDAGGIVMHTVGSAAEACRAVDAGVDVVVAQGWEAGGHVWEAGGHVWGEVGTFSLVPAVADAVAPIPVVAAGGIADGRGVAAALMLGASGVWIGTRFLASQEAAIHLVYKQKLLEASEADTVYSSLFDKEWPNAPHRVLRNSTVKAWEEAGRPEPPNRPNEQEVIAYHADGKPIERYSDTIPLLGMTGHPEALALYAGQSVGLISEIRPAREIVLNLAADASDVLSNIRHHESKNSLDKSISELI